MDRMYQGIPSSDQENSLFGVGMENYITNADDSLANCFLADTEMPDDLGLDNSWMNNITLDGKLMWITLKNTL